MIELTNITIWGTRKGMLTTVRTAPGFCTLRAFTTWKTSTTPSVLHRSMVVAMAQNMPQRLTVSLQKGHIHIGTQSQVGYGYSVPAVHHNGLVTSPPLNFGHLLNHINHSLQARAATIRSPVGDVKLTDLLRTSGL